MIRSRKQLSWTEEEDAAIRSLVAKGASDFRASAALKRSRATVRDRARMLGCPFPTIKEARQKLRIGIFRRARHREPCFIIPF
jgi:hypothetical protein